MAGIIIGAAIGALVGWYFEPKLREIKSNYTGGNKCVKCAYAHSASGMNYVWLEPNYGKVLRIEYKEPAETGPWLDYTDKIWKIHCEVINHGKNLVEDHMQAFVSPRTRFAKLRFTFNKNGKIYTREPDIDFYRLEKEFFDKHNICEH